MPYVADDEEDDSGDEDDFDEREYPDDAEADWNLDPATVICAYCHEEISEDASQCPRCRKYISREDAPRERKPAWIVLGMVFVVVLLLMWILLIR
jgi:predicted nucleic acid-binding Zn ribbon protein